METGPLRARAFRFRRERIPADTTSDLGFAGFRILYPLRKRGGPYERKRGALRRSRGLSRGELFSGREQPRAVVWDLGFGLRRFRQGSGAGHRVCRTEEFRILKEFWIEKPKPQSETLTVYALLDSPSAAGAYRFVIHPGIDLSMEVKARVFFRKGVRRMGVAPLTSMFFHGDHGDRQFDDFRPEVHDSDGLLIAMQSGEWLWRPLNNPRKVATSVFAGEDIAGFGLMQRDRIFDHYQDLTSMYHARPSTWVEPLGRWDRNRFISSKSQATPSSMTTSWPFCPEKSTAAGQEWSFDYR